MKKDQIDRGRIAHVKLKRPVVLNSLTITEAIIEIDHINFGINKNNHKLNAHRRTNFTVNDIEKFIHLLDGEFLAAERYYKTLSIFELRVDCPIVGKFFGKEFVMIFSTDHKKQNQIYTVTLFPNW